MGTLEEISIGRLYKFKNQYQYSKKIEQAGAELGQAQPKLGISVILFLAWAFCSHFLWQLLSFDILMALYGKYSSWHWVWKVVWLFKYRLTIPFCSSLPLIKVLLCLLLGVLWAPFFGPYLGGWVDGWVAGESEKRTKLSFSWVWSLLSLAIKTNLAYLKLKLRLSLAK